MKHLVFDLGDTAQWILGIGLVVWIAQYSVYAPWWSSPLGRSIVWLAVSFELVLIPSLLAISGVNRGFIGSTGYDYLEVANLVFAAVVVLARIYQFRKEHRKGRLDHHGKASAEE